MRPLLVGLDNPLSPDASLALSPWPSGCAGFRLWQMVREVRGDEFTQLKYLKAFDRINLYGSHRAKNGKGSSEVDQLLADLILTMAVQGRREHIVLLGKRVCHAFVAAVPKEVTWLSQFSTDHELRLTRHGKRHTIWWTLMPHPSGRNYWYNDSLRRTAAAVILADLSGEA